MGGVSKLKLYKGESADKKVIYDEYIVGKLGVKKIYFVEDKNPYYEIVFEDLSSIHIYKIDFIVAFYN